MYAALRKSPPMHWISEWFALIHLCAAMLVLVLSPSANLIPHRKILAWHLYRNTAPVLVGFSLLCAVVTVVITRIVLVTAQSYGLSTYALEVVVRVLVLELIPLAAAIFVALRCTIPASAELYRLRTSVPTDRSAASNNFLAINRLQAEVLPRAFAGMFAGITLCALSCVVTLVSAYLVGYGFSVSGLTHFTRIFGQVFSPAVSLIFCCKATFFSIAVALVPMASSLLDGHSSANTDLRASGEVRALVRMFVLVLLIEIASLLGNYY